jgi:hypothetical protein
MTNDTTTVGDRYTAPGGAYVTVNRITDTDGDRVTYAPVCEACGDFDAHRTGRIQYRYQDDARLVAEKHAAACDRPMPQSGGSLSLMIENTEGGTA